jgi:hypothetical protein
MNSPLHQFNVVVLRKFQRCKTDELLTTGAITTFDGLLLIVGPNQGESPRGRLPNLERTGSMRLVRWWRIISLRSLLHPAQKFRRRIWMRKHAFARILEAVQRYDAYFVLRRDALDRKGTHPILKVTAALRLIVSGASTDQLNSTNGSA